MGKKIDVYLSICKECIVSKNYVRDIVSKMFENLRVNKIIYEGIGKVSFLLMSYQDSKFNL